MQLGYIAGIAEHRLSVGYSITVAVIPELRPLRAPATRENEQDVQREQGNGQLQKSWISHGRKPPRSVRIN